MMTYVFDPKDMLKDFYFGHPMGPVGSSLPSTPPKGLNGPAGPSNTYNQPMKYKMGKFTFNLLGPSAMADTNTPQCINSLSEVYLLRDKKTGLYVGYDGYDTDFSKGISAFIAEAEILKTFNKQLIHHSLEEIEALLKVPADKRWVKYGGYDNLDVIRMDVMLDGEAFSPSDLAHVLTIERLEAEQDDAEAQQELNLADNPTWQLVTQQQQTP